MQQNMFDFCIHESGPESRHTVYCCSNSNCDRLGFSAEIQIIVANFCLPIICPKVELFLSIGSVFTPTQICKPGAYINKQGNCYSLHSKFSFNPNSHLVIERRRTATSPYQLQNNNNNNLSTAK